MAARTRTNSSLATVSGNLGRTMLILEQDGHDHDLQLPMTAGKQSDCCRLIREVLNGDNAVSLKERVTHLTRLTLELPTTALSQIIH